MRLGIEAGKDTLDVAAELEVKGVPISAGLLVKDGVDAVLAPLQERGLAVCQIGSTGFNPLSDDADAQRAQAGVLRQAIPLARETGCRYITIGPGNHHPSGFAHYDARNFTDDAIAQMAEAIKPMIELAEKHDVCLSVEPYLKGAINSAERFKALHARVGSDALRANVDPSSLYDFWDVVDPAAKVAATCTGLAGHVGIVHLKEIGIDPGVHIKMGLKPIGEGTTDWAQLLKLVAPHVPDDSWVLLEHVLSAEEARVSVERIRAAAREAGVSLT
ncbi:MAG: sugar phosphate isomerase/epimerase family protein [Phycisphaeraceae bacterium]